MKDRRAALIARVGADLDVIAARLPAAVASIVENKAGAKGTRYDPENAREARYELDEAGHRIPIVTPADPTGDAAIARAENRLEGPDPALAALRSLDQNLRLAETASRNVRDIVTRWASTDPTLADDAGCEIVGTVTGVFEPTHRRGFDHEGTLPVRFRVGRWAYDFIRRTDRLPTEPEIRQHVEGRRIKAKK